MTKRALIIGITGQDGSYLAELLAGKLYDVHGVIRRSSLFNTDRIDHMYCDPHSQNPGVRLHYGDLTDASTVRRVLEDVKPDEVYNLAAQSHVRVSFDMPEYTADVVAMGTLRIIEALRDHVIHSSRAVRYYQAGSSEMFGAAPPPQNEKTPFYPRSPYGVSKLAAHWFSINYREAYNLFICNGILFNHESPRRGETFVTRKVTRAVGRISQGLQDKLYLGNLSARRDWGYAADYVEAMWLMLQQDEPDDFVIATGETHSVGELVELAFAEAGLDWRRHVVIDQRYLRPTEVDNLCGDAAKATDQLGWRPRVTFPELIKMMVAHDCKLAQSEQALSQAGFITPARGAAMAGGN